MFYIYTSVCLCIFVTTIPVSESLQLNVEGIPDPHTCQQDIKNNLKTVCVYNYDWSQVTREVEIGCHFDGGSPDDMYQVAFDGQKVNVSARTSSTLWNTRSLKRWNTTITFSAISKMITSNVIIVHFNYVPRFSSTAANTSSTTLQALKPTESVPQSVAGLKSSQTALWILLVVVGLALLAVIIAVIYYKTKVKRRADSVVVLSNLEHGSGQEDTRTEH